MANVTTTSRKPVHAAPYGNKVTFSDTVAVATSNLLLDDAIRVVYVPAGTAVDRVLTRTTDMDTGANTLQVKIGFVPVDGSAAPPGADVAVSGPVTWGTAAETRVFDVIPPYTVEVDSYLAIVVTTPPSVAAAGTVHVIVDGEARGVR